MTRGNCFFVLVFIFFWNGYSQEKAEEFLWPGGQKLAVSLSYDDALDTQLDFVVPSLEKFKLKASFYILPNAPSLNDRLEEWRAVVEKGHELGNHSMYHPCRKSLPGRDWVPAHHDLDRYSLEQMLEELTTANTFLKAIDGKSERTFTPPCGVLMIENEKEYIQKLHEIFVAYKGQGLENDFSAVYAPQGVSGEQLIELVKNVPKKTSLVNIIFHGIEGDYLSVSAEAHNELLKFLADNSKDYYVDTFINIMKYANAR